MKKVLYGITSECASTFQQAAELAKKYFPAADLVFVPGESGNEIMIYVARQESLAWNAVRRMKFAQLAGQVFVFKPILDPSLHPDVQEENRLNPLRDICSSLLTRGILCEQIPAANARSSSIAV